MSRLRKGCGRGRRARREDAEKRQQERRRRTASQQLGRLDRLLGKNLGVRKERGRLLAEVSRGAV